jgi:predicted porin
MLYTNTQGATSGKSPRRSAALSAAIVAALAMAASGTALADAELDALKQQVQDLQHKIDAMAKQQAATAAAAPAAAPAKAPVEVTATRPDGPLSMYGITLYGALDLNLMYQTHGTPISDYFPGGTFSYIQKAANNNIFTLGENGLSVSRIGLQGEKEIMNGWAGVFRLETAIMPLSGNIADALKSVTINNGRPLTSQLTGVDSSYAGELFNGAAFAGFSHKDYGTFTFGRQNGLLADGIAKYDPMAVSQAFSVIGISGTAAGGGDTENRRLDNSVKYDARYGALHVGAQYQFNGSSGQPGTAIQLALGGSFAQGSIDAYYAKKRDAIGASSLTAAQVSTLNCPYTVATGAAAPCNVPGGGGNAIDKSLFGTVSDNAAWSVMGQYAFGSTKLFGGYEHIAYSNPTDPLRAGTYTIGGYVLAYVNQQYNTLTNGHNNSSFPIDKILQIEWVGLKFTFTPSLDGTVAWYHLDQSAFADPTGAFAGCNDDRSAACSGKLDAVSFDLVYKMSKRLDAYGGAMWSEAKDGLANGFLYRTTIDPTIGFRYSF